MILKNCRLVPQLCEGFEQEMADIRVEGNTIAEILPAGGSYTGEEVIDCTGKTVLPGLFNTHLHIMWDIQSVKKRKPAYSEFDFTINSMRYMQTLLAYGYTSVRDVGTPYNIAIKLRDYVNNGELVGPDIKASGIILTPSQVGRAATSHSSSYGQAYNDPYQLRAAARQQLADGADFIKILGCSMAPGKRGPGQLFYPDEMREVCEVVKREGVYLSVHTNSTESNTLAIEAEARVIDHAHQLTPENVDAILQRGSKSMIAATLSVCALYGGVESARKQAQGIRLAHDAGINIGWGTDVAEDAFLEDPAREFTLRQSVFGLSNVEILKQATINSAVINQTEALRGSIKVGKRADFAVFDGKPDEDFSLFGKPCACVIKDGVVVARNGLVKGTLAF